MPSGLMLEMQLRSASVVPVGLPGQDARPCCRAPKAPDVPRSAPSRKPHATPSRSHRRLRHVHGERRPTGRSASFQRAVPPPPERGLARRATARRAPTAHRQQRTRHRNCPRAASARPRCAEPDGGQGRGASEACRSSAALVTDRTGSPSLFRSAISRASSSVSCTASRARACASRKSSSGAVASAAPARRNPMRAAVSRRKPVPDFVDRNLPRSGVGAIAGHGAGHGTGHGIRQPAPDLRDRA